MSQTSKPLGDRKTAGYRPRVFGGYRSAVIDGKPRFLLSDVDRMLDDPQVQFCLRILRSPLFGVEFEFGAVTPEATAFGKAQLERIWKRSISQFSRFLEYGYCAGELTFAEESERVVFDRFYDVHPLDAHPLLYKGGPNHGKVAAVRVRSSSGQNSGSGQFDLEAPNAFWFAGETRYGSLFGYPRTAGMYEPWLEKAGKGGAKQARQGWYFKNASRGGMMRHPDGTTDMGDAETGPRLMSNQDLARQILELHKSGGIVVMPNERDKANPADYAWIWEDPKTNADVAGLRDYPKDLDREILIGGGVPPELVEASTVGSGYSGRAIPAQVFFTSMDEVIALLLEAIDHQILKYLMRVNFGDVRYEARAKSLAQAVQEDPAQAGKMLGGGEQQGEGGRTKLVPFSDQKGAGRMNPVSGRKYRLGEEGSESLRDRVRRLAEMDYPDLESVELGWSGTTSRTGGIKAVGTGPDAGKPALYGDKARSAIEGRGEKFKAENEGRTPKENLQAQKQQAEPKRQAARDTLAKVAEDPSHAAKMTPEELVEHISHLTRDELKEYARKMDEKMGGKKAELAKRIAEKALASATNKEEETSPSETKEGRPMTTVKEPHQMTREEYAKEHHIDSADISGKTPHESYVGEGYQAGVDAIGEALDQTRNKPAEALAKAKAKAEQLKAEIAEDAKGLSGWSERAKAHYVEAQQSAIDAAIKDAEEYYSSGSKSTGFPGFTRQPKKRGEFSPTERRVRELAAVISKKYPLNSTSTSEGHRIAVMQAVRAGKQVPPEVLADYPGLFEKALGGAKPEEAATARTPPQAVASSGPKPFEAIRKEHAPILELMEKSQLGSEKEINPASGYVDKSTAQKLTGLAYNLENGHKDLEPLKEAAYLMSGKIGKAAFPDEKSWQQAQELAYDLMGHYSDDDIRSAMERGELPGVKADKKAVGVDPSTGGLLYQIRSAEVDDRTREASPGYARRLAEYLERAGLAVQPTGGAKPGEEPANNPTASSSPKEGEAVKQTTTTGGDVAKPTPQSAMDIYDRWTVPIRDGRSPDEARKVLQSVTREDIAKDFEAHRSMSVQQLDEALKMFGRVPQVYKTKGDKHKALIDTVFNRISTFNRAGA